MDGKYSSTESGYSNSSMNGYSLEGTNTDRHHHPAFTEHQRLILHFVLLAGSILTLLGTGSVLLAYLVQYFKKPQFKEEGAKMICLITLPGFLGAFFWFPWQPKTNESFCLIQATGIQFFELSSLVWSSCIVIVFLKNVVFPYFQLGYSSGVGASMSDVAFCLRGVACATQGSRGLRCHHQAFLWLHFRVARLSGTVAWQSYSKLLGSYEPNLHALPCANDIPTDSRIHQCTDLRADRRGKKTGVNIRSSSSNANEKQDENSHLIIDYGEGSQRYQIEYSINKDDSITDSNYYQSIMSLARDRSDSFDR
ncbi:hypothetical protein PPL_12435 [Heterostelium album PN500]|uniref:Uncharacterized protein n=1 Tax=Heterostelium pallidum (strain ATCC 26659 / Pp 5 / PN500) TaxID=670386 RepID=D3BML3_HETP5|nr:hypothetical protein PPL_12435 [Heterostelium album PN500]EFA77225.1 hypothetical protein PPL_12435 [Heterostelium album PN500]|eukprot:XP_020429354.1 hypothetical protein PPL_12435 [Heterostelium album PN500]